MAAPLSVLGLLCGVAPAQGQGMSAPAISPATVAGLSLVHAFRTGSAHGHAGAPLVAGGLLALMTPFPHTLFALDLAAPQAPIKWIVRPHADGRAEGLACCDTVNGGPAESGADLIVNTLDGHTIAVDRMSGAIRWDNATADLGKGDTLTAAPVVANGTVLVGSSGDDAGARGWIAALDAATGHEIWRKYSTGPDAEVGVGPDSRTGGAPTDAGLHSWPPDGWQHGGGEVAGSTVVDPDGTTLYHGTGHAAPWNPDQRPGDNRWTSSLFARDVATGAVRWVDQLQRHDDFALGSTGAILLADRPWHGAMRKLLIHPDRDGYVYVLDRTTGAILSAQPFTTVNETSGIDASGSTIPVDSHKARFATTTRDVCPGWPGATAGGAALSADARMVFIPVSRLCMDFEARSVSFIPGTAYVGANTREKRPADGMGGALVGWDIESGRLAWAVPETFPVAGGVLVTGGLVFYGTLDGAFKALDAGTGRELWRFQASSGIIGQPIAFQGPDGRPEIAVLAGLGGAFGMVARDGIDRRDATAAHGMANALADLPRPADPSGTLYIFGLP